MDFFEIDFFQLVILVVLSQTAIHYLSIMTYGLIFLPFTILHELQHFLVGFLLKAKPTQFSIIPVRQNNRFVLGSVAFLNINFLNALPIALAPLLSLSGGVFLVDYLVGIGWFDNWFKSFFSVMVVQMLIQSSLPSTTDLKIACQYPLGIMMYISLFGFLYQWI